MKRLLLVLSSIFAVSAHAATEDWTTQLENYRQQVQTYTKGQLYGDQVLNMAGAVTGCMGSVAFTAVAFVSDTLPVSAPVSEYIATRTNENYQSYQTFLSWETLANTGRGTVGGAAMGTYEAMEFVLYWLSGDSEKSFAQLKQIYASTFATAEALFSKESACLMNTARVGIIKAEWRRRAGLAPVEMPYTPMYMH